MNSEEKKNQQQVNTQDTQEQAQKQEQAQQNDKTAEKEQTKESGQGNVEQTQEKDVKEEKKKSGSQKKDKSKKKEEKETSGEKEKAKENKEEEQSQEAEAGQEVKGEEKTDKEKLAELQDKYLRLNAEYDNYRKRTLKEKMELTKTAGEDILKGLLPVMDDFERALQSIDEAGDNQAVKDGVQLIYNKFKEFLKQQGVQEIEAQDMDFDTDKHEAISKVPAQEEDQKGKVVDVVQKGYYLNDKVLRYAKVVVGE